MPLSDEHMQAAQQHIRAHLEACPSCGSQNVGVRDEAVILTIYSENAIHIKSGIPQIVGSCTDCGHTVLFSADQIAGITADEL
jgi:predicted nucleic-acid-binding Zn-ribbon protein